MYMYQACVMYCIAGFYCESFNFANSELLAKIKIRTKNLYAILLGYSTLCTGIRKYNNRRYFFCGLNGSFAKISSRNKIPLYGITLLHLCIDGHSHVVHSWKSVGRGFTHYLYHILDAVWWYALKILSGDHVIKQSPVS